MRDLDELFARLGRSRFRSAIRLRGRELAYLHEKGRALVLAHAADFIAERLAPAQPKNDGKQTPWRNHPAFVAQHATATCCRGCLAKWHAIDQGRPLSAEEQNYIIAVIDRWQAAFDEADGRESEEQEQKAIEGTEKEREEEGSGGC